MKAAPTLEPRTATDVDLARHEIMPSVAIAEVGYEKEPATTVKAPSQPVANRPEFTTLRALTRNVFGVEAGRECLKEVVVFAFMMAVAAWPLSITLDMLGTMRISPPTW